MKKRMVMLLTALVSTFTFVQASGSFSGMVVDEADQPIAGATVTFDKKPELVFTSDASGNFATGIVTSKTMSHRGQVIAAFTGKVLFIAADKKQIPTVNLFNSRGQRLYTQRLEHLSQKSAHLTLPNIATGRYMLKVTVGTETATFNAVFGAHHQLSVRSFSPSVTSAPRSLAKVNAGAIDNALALADGYLMGSTPVTSYDETGVKIVCIASNQWMPAAEELEHEDCMVKIKAAGTKFSMGQPAYVKEPGYDQPVHTVAFTYDYWMDTTEVTQKQFSEVMTEAYPEFSNAWIAKYGIGDNIAAYHVNEFDAIMYCNALSNKKGLDSVYSYEGLKGSPGELCSLFVVTTNYENNGYRLPTEAEWEYACRGGTASDYYWGKMYRPYPETPEDTAEISEYALWEINALYRTDNTYGLNQGVASKKPNRYGLYDMAGSLSEWYQLAYSEFPDEEVTDPKPPANIFVSYGRGGNWGNTIKYLRSACRAASFADYPYWQTGFRTVREVKE